MNRRQYDRYLELFHARDYDGLLDFFGPDPEVIFAGYALRGRAAIKDFYAFLHQYVQETVAVDRFMSDEHTLVLEARVRLEGLRDLTPEILKAHGYDRLASLRQGDVVEIPQFIHYHLQDGKFITARCAVFEAPRE